MPPTSPENAISYAALILVDASLAITPEALQTLLKAAGVEDVEPVWTTLFANALRGKDLRGILTAVASAEVQGDVGRKDGDEGKDADKGDDGIYVCEGSEEEDGGFGLGLFD